MAEAKRQDDQILTGEARLERMRELAKEMQRNREAMHASDKVVEITETWDVMGRTEVDLTIGTQSFRVTVSADGNAVISESRLRRAEVTA